VGSRYFQVITLSGLRNLLLDLSRRGCYLGLETQSPDNLFERGIIALGAAIAANTLCEISWRCRIADAEIESLARETGIPRPFLNQWEPFWRCGESRTTNRVTSGAKPITNSSRIDCKASTN
jgi:hypothetical protein